MLILFISFVMSAYFLSVSSNRSRSISILLSLILAFSLIRCVIVFDIFVTAALTILSSSGESSMTDDILDYYDMELGFLTTVLSLGAVKKVLSSDILMK